MVMNRSIDLDNPSADDEEGFLEEGPFYDDEDLVESGQAMEMMENVETNPTFPRLRLSKGKAAKKQKIGNWQSLRPADKSAARTSPFLNTYSAKDWTTYINKMRAKDAVLELDAAVSTEERASLYLFAEEWRNDVTHERFRRRLYNHREVNVSDEIKKGQLVSDVALGAIAPPSVSTTGNSRMLRLAMDILQSINLQNYNFYSVNLLHRDEGSAVYEEFLTRYVPLDTHEVGILTEMSNGISGQGRAYAANTTSRLTDPVQNFALMLRAVEAYQIGDTRTARAAMNLLLGAPINYQSSAAFSINIDPLGRPQEVREGNIAAVFFQAGTMAKDKQKNAPMRYIQIKGWDSKGQTIDFPYLKEPKEGEGGQKGRGGKLDIGRITNRYTGATFIEVDSLHSSKPINVIEFTAPKPTDKPNYIFEKSYQSWIDQGGALPIAQRQLQEQDTQQQKRRSQNYVRGGGRGGRGGGGRTNPVNSMVRGAATYISKNYPNIRLMSKRSSSPEKLEEALKGAKAETLATLEDRFVIFGHNGFYAIGDSGLKDFEGEGKHHTVKSFSEQYPNEWVVFGPSGWWPFGKPTKSNPVTVGRGQHFFIEILDKHKMSFTKKQKKFGAKVPKRSPAKTIAVGTPGKEPPWADTGLRDIFGGFETQGYVTWKGTHKKTGKSVPWLIQLPKKKGKRGKIVFRKRQVTKNGKTYSTIRPFGAPVNVKRAWKKFTEIYGEPVYANDPKQPNKFKMSAAGRGIFYQRLANGKKNPNHPTWTKKFAIIPTKDSPTKLMYAVGWVTNSQGVKVNVYDNTGHDIMLPFVLEKDWNRKR